MRQLKQKVLTDFEYDLTIYRKYADELLELRKANGDIDHSPGCLDLYVSLGLKHSHLYNDYAAIAYIDRLLSQQLDLFG